MAEPNENDPTDRPWDRGGRNDYDDRPPRRRRDDRDDDYDRPRRRRRDEFDDRPRGPETNGAASTALVLGLLALVPTVAGAVLIALGGWMAMLGSIILYVSGLLGLPAAIFGGVGLTRRVKRGTAQVGLLLGILGVLAGIGGLAYSLVISVGKVRTAAARMNDQNNLKQLAVGLHNDNNQYGSITPYARDNTGKVQPGLSFRVSMLPYMGESALHRQFDLTQPWDSLRNRPHSDTPVKPYITAFDGNPNTTNTPYRGFVGGGALFDEKWPTRLDAVPDGTSNTIMLVHATEQVPWASPRELRYDPKGPLPPLGHKGMEGGTNILMADGSVRFVRKEIPESTMRKLITRADGEVITVDW